MNNNELISIIRFAGYTAIAGYLTIEYIYPFWKKYFCAPGKYKLKQLGGIKISNLNNYEMELLNGLVLPGEIKSGFDSIGGLKGQIEILQSNLLLFFNQRNNNSSLNSLVSLPSGILFYGPPGCGKTMLARALAKESNYRFLSISLATILDKWFGESEKYINAIFSLAKKLSPCIVFIDEIDSITKKRCGFDMNESMSNLKSHFLSLWNDVSVHLDDKVLILGATNRKQDIDEAFMRRMPLHIEIGLPDEKARIEIFKLLLLNASSDLNWEFLAGLTINFSPSDIKEVCRRAAVECLYKNYPQIAMTQLEEAIYSITNQKN